MNIVLTCINNFQEYILTNIEQLIKLGHTHIYVITNKCFFNMFNQCSSNIILVDIHELNENYDFTSISTLDKQFRNGFWFLASLRFFYIYELMNKYNLEDVIHLENDVLIFYNCCEILKYVNKNYMYIPFDSYKRNIASIIYIPNKEVFKNILDHYNFKLNDMQNFSFIKLQTGLIQNFPIFIKNNTLSDEQLFVSENSELFPFIFDAAAIGQYLGGVDPRNISGDTTGFINETCVIKYNNYRFLFKNIDNVKKPFILIENNEIPIFNLHVHCKNLHKFI